MSEFSNSYRYRTWFRGSDDLVGGADRFVNRHVGCSVTGSPSDFRWMLPLRTPTTDPRRGTGIPGPSASRRSVVRDHRYSPSVPTHTTLGALTEANLC